ncbi:erythromycin esterase family protein [Bacillaceae bacterium SIJ1]|uniref:erythromycin esterase family protein n=1 Tax=Litoribacterium kuwaitense TaxID=1398745 RepID=UPI0013EB35DF|nr:erythromycin esterase family protein [Litoribacterium kuwaitense]NGP45400.1 erythromycin esterase family protein [Litoribacterium kuwaitense]
MLRQQLAARNLVFIVFIYVFLLAQPHQIAEADAQGERVDRWEEGIERLSHNVFLSGTHEQKDLDFLKPLINDKRIVLIGESAHGAREFNAVKARIIRYLHEEMGFSVIAFEAPMGQSVAAFAQSKTGTASQTMTEGIPSVWHSPDMERLFSLMKSKEEQKDFLTFTGIDIQPDSFFGPFLSEGVYHLDRSRSNKIRQMEEHFYELYHNQATIDQAFIEANELQPQYEELKSWIRRHQSELRKSYTNSVIKQIERVVDNRIHFLKHGVQARVKSNAQTNQHPSTVTDIQQSDMYYRDRQMAENIDWLAHELFPDEKMIVIGHNYHIRKQNTAMHSFVTFEPYMKDPLPTMGELLSERLKASSYALGVFAYKGQTYDRQGAFVNMDTNYDEFSLEPLLESAGHRVTFMQLTGTRLDPTTSWMTMPMNGSYWGMQKETFIPRQQYDGLLLINEVSPALYAQPSK